MELALRFPSISLGLFSYYGACECLHVTLYVSSEWVCLYGCVWWCVCVCVKQCFRFWVLIPAAHGLSYRTIWVLFEHWAKRPHALKLLAFPRAFRRAFCSYTRTNRESLLHGRAVKFKRVCAYQHLCGWQRFYDSFHTTDIRLAHQFALSLMAYVICTNIVHTIDRQKGVWNFPNRVR